MLKQSSIFKKVGFASLIMMASVFASRIIGLAREMIIAFTGGTGGDVDAYQISFIIPEILNHIVASGFLSITFIPIFTAYLVQKKEEHSWKIFSIIFNTFGFFLLIFILVSFYFAPEIVKIFAPGFKDPVLFKKAVKMTRIIIPAQFFFFAGGLFMAVQFAKEKFLIPAFAPILYNLGIIAGGVCLNKYLGIQGFAWGVLLGAFFGNFVLQYFGAKKIGMKIYPFFNIKHPEFIKYLFLTLPLILGLTMTFSMEILFKFFGSFLEKGSIAAMNYAFRIMLILVGLFGQAVGVASYPFMAKFAAENNMDSLNNLLNQTLKLLLLVIPFSILLMVLRHEIVFILFKRGKFDINAVILTAGVLPFFLAGTFAFAGQTVVTRGYYAMQNTWIPALVSTATVLLSFPMFYILMKLMGIKGVGLALFITTIIQILFLFELWNRKKNNIKGKTVYFFFMKMLGISFIIGLILLKITSFLQNIFNSSTMSGCWYICIITGIFFLLFFIGFGFIFKIQEISILFKKGKYLNGSKKN